MLNAMTDEEYMQLALQEARAADVIGEIPIGAVLVVEGEVVSCNGQQTLVYGLS